MSKKYYVYILESERGKTPYIGVTGNIVRRMFEHKNHLIRGYTDRYNSTKLIYFEELLDPNEAIKREKQLKGWTRKKKYDLVDRVNPDRDDLAKDWGIVILSPKERWEWMENYRKMNEGRKNGGD